MKKYSHKSESEILHQKAEDLLKKKPLQDDVQLSSTEARRLTYELKKHQIELELQNEDLKSSRSLAQETAEKYTELYDFAPSGYFTLSNAGEIIDVNLCGSQMLGIERSRLKNKHFNLFLSRETKPVFSLFLEKVFFSKFIETCEITISSDDNLLVYLHLSGIIDKNLEKCFITAVDITKLRQAEEAVKEQKEKLQNQFINAPIGIFHSDWEGRLLFANPALAKMLGYFDVEELISVTSDMATQIYADPKIRPPIMQALKENFGWVHYHDLIWKRKDQHLITVDMTARKVLDPLGVFDYLEGFIEDITERKHAEDERKQLSDRLSLATRASGIGVWDYDIVNNILLWDDQMYELYGIQNKDFIGVYETWHNGVHPDDKERGDKEIKMAIQGEKEFDTEFRVLWPDGSVHNIRALAIVQRDDSGKALHMIGTNWDITKQKLVEQQLLKAKEHAEESDRLKSAFLANMSHEIRTPMNGILGFTELLREPKLSGKEQERYLGIIQKSCNRLLCIINDIVDISKIEAGQMGTTLSEVNVNEKIEDVYNFFLPQAEQKGIHFFYKCSLPSDQARIKSDKEKIFAILTNLVKNALKFTYEGFIEFGYEKKGSFLEFFVKDTGIGVSEDNKDVIFIRFRQGGKISSKTKEGSGLGLSISKAYVEMLGGKIWVESEEDQGSTFYFTIPYITEKQVQSINPDILPAVEESGQIKNLKILIAEDDETSDVLITNILNKTNHEFLHAVTGNETIEVCRNHPNLDLILMDIRMPDLSGLEATQQIRQFNKSVIIIAQTAYALTGDREKAIASGCNDYISKPIDNEELKALIQKHFKV